jgi:hypothetical protein
VRRVGTVEVKLWLNDSRKVEAKRGEWESYNMTRLRERERRVMGIRDYDSGTGCKGWTELAARGLGFG